MATFALGVSDHIMIAHSFPAEFFGPAVRTHGATFAIELELRTASLNRHHAVAEINALRAILRTALDTLDYQNLDEHPAFPHRSATAERVAEHVAMLVAQALTALPEGDRPPSGASLRVVVRESPVAYAAFERAL